jgi:hypothetical protein
MESSKCDSSTRRARNDVGVSDCKIQIPVARHEQNRRRGIGGEWDRERGAGCETRLICAIYAGSLQIVTAMMSQIYQEETNVA